MPIGAMTTSLAVAGTIWGALLLYVAGEYGRGRRPAASWARTVWVLGSLLYVAHVTVAFALHHDWSHAAAYAYTAAETEAFVGIASGLGIWVNYAFTALWVAEGLWTPRWAPDADRRVSRVVRGVFLFMIVNAAVVFVTGPQRWLGVGIVAALLAIWWRGPAPQAPSKLVCDTRRARAAPSPRRCSAREHRRHRVPLTPAGPQRRS